MNTTPPTILLFEDQKRDGDLVAEALQRALPSTLVWFRKVPSRLSLRYARYDYFPLEANSGEEPQVRLFNAKSYKKGKARWWQGEFDGAILDLFQDGQPVAADFLTWLQWARFLGPVVLATYYTHPTQHFPLLPGLERLSKREEHWQQKAVSLLLPGLHAYQQTVGGRGRDPSDRDCVKHYWEYVSANAQDTPAKILSLWIGSDLEVRDQVTAFLGHDEITLRPGWAEAKKRWAARSAKDDPVGILGEFLDRGGRSPSVLWLDTGDADCSLDDQRELIERLKRAVPKSFVALLANQLTGLTTDLERHFTRLGIITIDRAALLDQPARWAQETVDEFALHLEIARRVEDRPPLDPHRIRCILKLFRSYFRLLLMARSKRYVSGQDLDKIYGIPSIVPWLSGYPLSTNAVKTSFDTYARQWANELRIADLVSDDVLKLAGIRGPIQSEDDGGAQNRGEEDEGA